MVIALSESSRGIWWGCGRFGPPDAIVCDLYACRKCGALVLHDAAVVKDVLETCLDEAARVHECCCLYGACDAGGVRLAYATASAAAAMMYGGCGSAVCRSRLPAAR